MINTITFLQNRIQYSFNGTNFACLNYIRSYFKYIYKILLLYILKYYFSYLFKKYRRKYRFDEVYPLILSWEKFLMTRDQLMYQPSSQTSVSMLIQAGLILLLWRGLQLGFFVISGWVSNMPSSSSIISDDDSDIELFFKCWPVNQTRQSSTTSFIRHLSFRKPLHRETRIPSYQCMLSR